METWGSEKKSEFSKPVYLESVAPRAEPVTSDMPELEQQAAPWLQPFAEHTQGDGHASALWVREVNGPNQDSLGRMSE